MTRRGFSLLETLLYTAITAAILTLVVGTFTGILRSYAHLALSRDLNTSGSAALERIIRDARSSSSLDAGQSTLNVHPSTVTLLDGAGASRAFALQNGVLRARENGADQGALTGSNVAVDSFIASYLENGGARLLTVRLTLTASRGGLEKTATFSGSAVLRGGY